MAQPEGRKEGRCTHRILVGKLERERQRDYLKV
jgi:hypothetical protein